MKPYRRPILISVTALLLLGASYGCNHQLAKSTMWDKIFTVTIPTSGPEDAVLDVPRPPAIPIGCQLTACGKSGPGPIDISIQLTSDFVESITVEFENLSQDAIEKIGVQGSGKFISPNRFEMRRGKTLLIGLTPVEAMRRSSGVFAVDAMIPPILNARLVVSPSAVKKARIEAAVIDHSIKERDIGTASIFVHQLRGTEVVNDMHLLYRFRLSKKPLPTEAKPLLFPGAEPRRAASAPPPEAPPVHAERLPPPEVEPQRAAPAPPPDAAEAPPVFGAGPPIFDYLTLMNSDQAGEAVLFYSGTRGTKCLPVVERVEGTGTIPIRNMWSSKENCEARIVTFSPDAAVGAMQLDMDWTNKPGDLRSITLPPEMTQVPLTFWFLHSESEGEVHSEGDVPFSFLKTNATEHLNYANTRFNRGVGPSGQNINNYCGFEFLADEESDFQDKRDIGETIVKTTVGVLHPDGSVKNEVKLNQVHCGVPEVLEQLTLKGLFKEKAINVYYVDRMFDRSAANNVGVFEEDGVHGCDPQNSIFIFIAPDAQKDTLAHELGHVLGLGHVPSVVAELLPPGSRVPTEKNQWTKDNLMLPGISTRTKLTKGQCFKCNNPDLPVFQKLGIKSPLAGCKQCPSLDLDAD